ncbi:hypothetical protein CEXT_247741 [Caerostris extrusa]|uniref:Uncharacterized protein n=1 Tax=Caerostris extrusa TaxID=172846 RepID=A0AAV4MQ63_CAEEX|nr:hypothetical protein CEXT_247741 [Caerostris extrusa]
MKEEGREGKPIGVIRALCALFLCARPRENDKPLNSARPGHHCGERAGEKGGHYPASLSSDGCCLLLSLWSNR